MQTYDFTNHINRERVEFQISNFNCRTLYCCLSGKGTRERNVKRRVGAAAAAAAAVISMSFSENGQSISMEQLSSKTFNQFQSDFLCQMYFMCVCVYMCRRVNMSVSNNKGTGTKKNLSYECVAIESTIMPHQNLVRLTLQTYTQYPFTALYDFRDIDYKAGDTLQNYRHLGIPFGTDYSRVTHTIC